MSSYTLEPVGFIRSVLKRREEAPRQGPEGAPDAWLEIEPQFAEALLGMAGRSRTNRYHVVARGQARRAQGASTQRSEPPAHWRVLHALTCATESSRAASRDGA